MTFPFEYRGEIKFSDFAVENSDNFQQQFLTKMAQELELVKAHNIVRLDNQLSFTGRILSFGSNWNVLTQIDKGYIEVSPSADGIVILYKISFRVLLILVSLLLVIGLGSIFASKGGAVFSLTGKIAISIVAWLWLFGMNWLIAVIRFPAFIERVAKQTRI